MQIFITEDGLVSKYIHDDGSETAIKFASTAKNIFSDENGIEFQDEQRNKYTVFISTTKGCFMKCKFCHLTMKGCDYKKLEHEEVLSNIKEAITEQMTRNPELANFYVKLSWMSMGDALNESEKVLDVSVQLMDWLMKESYCKGLDGVDLSTVYPKMKNMTWVENFKKLNQELGKYPQNPLSFKPDQKNDKYSTMKDYQERTPFRLFYSIHSAVQENRENMIPNAKPVKEAMKILIENTDEYNLIFHHMFLNGINDSQKETDALIELVKENCNGHELRILRYNECSSGFFFFESDEFKNIIKKIQPYIGQLKVQISAGSEVKAACGQFIVSNLD